jgi:hypothetical protein
MAIDKVFMRRIVVGGILMAIALGVLAMNKSNKGIDPKYVGTYVQGSVDSRAQLFLFDDGYFCFTFMGGALDSMKVGRWYADSEADTIELQEIRPASNPHPILARRLNRLNENLIGINFDGYSLSQAHSSAYALSDKDEIPTHLKLLFSPGKYNWSETYALPLMDKSKAKYLFIADKKIEGDEFDDKTSTLRVSQYDLSGYDAIRVAFDRVQSEPLMKGQAALNDGKLYLGHEFFGTKEALDAEMAGEVHQHCIAPVIAKMKSQAGAGDKAPRDLTLQGVLLKPMKTFELPDSMISGPPKFADEDTDDSVTEPTDDWEQLIETEQKMLKSSLENAKKDFDQTDAFLGLSKSILGKKNRLAQQLPKVLEYQSELLVDIVGAGKYEHGKKLFNYIIQNTFPLVKEYFGRNMPYTVSVLASQGMILANVLKDHDIANTVFDTLLKGWYDIKTHDNTTLIYNIACYYAVNSQTKDMLKAIREARKRGTKPEQFLKDTDFKVYWQNPEFKKAIE